jgi:hypothetical protein
VQSGQLAALKASSTFWVFSSFSTTPPRGVISSQIPRSNFIQSLLNKHLVAGN